MSEPADEVDEPRWSMLCRAPNDLSCLRCLEDCTWSVLELDVEEAAAIAAGCLERVRARADRGD